MFLLSTNDKTIKLWKIYEKNVKFFSIFPEIFMFFFGNLYIYTFDTFVCCFFFFCCFLFFVFLFYIQVVERTNFNFGLDSDVVNKVSVFSEKMICFLVLVSTMKYIYIYTSNLTYIKLSHGILLFLLFFFTNTCFFFLFLFSFLLGTREYDK